MGFKKMILEKEKVNNDKPKVEYGSISTPVRIFSEVHGRRSIEYIPQWKTSQKFRQLNINIAKEYGISHSTHGHTHYLRKRERKSEHSQENLTEPDRVLRYAPFSHLSKYNSSLLHRKPNII